jgi:glutamate dehydrogenase/leucine dehydrogenase
VQRIVPFQEPVTKSIAYMKDSCRRLGLSEEETNAICDPQEVRLFKLPCNVLGETVIFPGILCLHNNARGPYKGGIRLDANVDIYETIELARVMTLKTAACDIEFGGGKTGIRVDWSQLLAKYGKKSDDWGFMRVIARSVIEKYAKLYGDLFRQHIYVPAPDMGTGPTEMAIIYNHTQDPASVTGKAEGVAGWLPGRKEATGLGVAWVTKLYVEEVMGKDLSQMTVAVQGFGNVGSHVAKYIYEMGAKVVGISDIYGGLYDANGIRVDQLLEHAAKKGTVVGFEAQSLSNEQLLRLPVDILIPAAAGHVIGVEEAKDAQAKLIVEAANVPITLDGMDVLNSRNIPVIPDIIANSGGVVASMEEYSRSLTAMRRTKEDVFDVIRHKLENALRAALAVAEQQDIDLCRAGVELAVQRVYQSMKNRHQI